MARRTRGTFSRRPAPRTKVWIGGGTGSTTIVGSTVQLLSVLNAAALAVRPFTILRTRLLVTFMSDQITVSETPFGSYGEIIVEDNASAIGVTAVPDPSSISGDPDADWHVWQACHHAVKEASAVGFTWGGGSQYVVDSKAMRKVGANQDLISVFASENVGADLNVQGRILIQLH